jgi:hypothetical protein
MKLRSFCEVRVAPEGCGQGNDAQNLLPVVAALALTLAAPVFAGIAS